eukprot:5059075-Ditylum_brightwellii.AAC.1
MQKVMSAMAKLSTNHPMLKQVMDGKDIIPDVLMTINDTASGMIRDINCCCKMETLGQDDSKQNKNPKITNDGKSEKAKKKEEAEKVGWLEKSSKGIFDPPQGLNAVTCTQHITLGQHCRFMLQN